MRRPTRKPETARPAALAAALLGCLAVAGVAAAESAPFRFISAPDLANADVEYNAPRAFDLDENDPDYAARRQVIVDARTLANAQKSEVKIDPNFSGDLNNDTVLSLQEGYRGGMQHMLEAIAGEGASFLTVAGDLIDGEWATKQGKPYANAELPIRQQHVRAQGDLYYDAYYANLADAGYTGTVYTVVGDHELGDNEWDRNKPELIPTFLDVYRQKTQMPETVAGDGAYVNAPAGYEGRVWARQENNVLLIGIETFEIQTDAQGVTTIDAHGYGGPGSKLGNIPQAQLDWLDATLALAATDPTIKHTMVMGHSPVDLPGVRDSFSSNLRIGGGTGSDLWQLFEAHGVDLYLAGEVHATSGYKRGGTTQIVTGGNPFSTRSAEYLAVEVFDDWIKLVLKSADWVNFEQKTNDWADPINDDASKAIEWRVAMDETYDVLGTLTLYTGYDMPYLVEATGALSQYVIDADGVPDGLSFPEVPTYVELADRLVGDTDLDGDVDMDDLLALAGAWRQPRVGWGKGDFNLDGRVDEFDLAGLASQWGAGVTGPTLAFDEALAAAFAVPEPGSLLIAAGLLLVVSPMRTRRGAA